MFLLRRMDRTKDVDHDHEGQTEAAIDHSAALDHQNLAVAGMTPLLAAVTTLLLADAARPRLHPAVVVVGTTADLLRHQQEEEEHIETRDPAPLRRRGDMAALIDLDLDLVHVLLPLDVVEVHLVHCREIALLQTCSTIAGAVAQAPSFVYHRSTPLHHEIARRRNQR